MLSVDRAKWKPAGSAKKAPPVEGFEVVLEDTVLFPEGGGQGLVDAILPLATYQPPVYLGLPLLTVTQVKVQLVTASLFRLLYDFTRSGDPMQMDSVSHNFKRLNKNDSKMMLRTVTIPLVN